jgi:excinuclease ABC subunit A
MQSPASKSKLKTLHEVGWIYQAGTALHHFIRGEAQRIKLSRELSRPSTGSTLYLLDEPTTGLHFDTINKLLKFLQAGS